jgi:serine/threonine protein kinase
MDGSVLGGRYRRVRRLGRGAMGDVWLAEDQLLHRPVAVKSIAATGPIDQLDLDRMMREARLAARLNHPNAVAVYDLVVEDGRPNVVMEYVAGDTLAGELVAAGGGLPPARVAAVGAAVADALDEAHRLGIAHRDVKPANILITERGTAKLADFGVARIFDDGGSTTTGLVIGTPAYVAPEVVRGGPADARSDIWSLGITLYAALEGHPPFPASGDSVLAVLGRVLNDPVPPPRRDAAVGAAIMRMLQRDPAARPSAATAAELLRNPLRPATGTVRRPTYGDGPERAPAFASAPTMSRPSYDRSPTDAPPQPATQLFASPTGPPSSDRPDRSRAIAVAAGAVVIAAVAALVLILATRGAGHPSASASASRAVGAAGGRRR